MYEFTQPSGKASRSRSVCVVVFERNEALTPPEDSLVAS
jgi:hypothetical protein